MIGSKYLRVMQREVSDFSFISPPQPNKAILAVENREQGLILSNTRDWYKVGLKLLSHGKIWVMEHWSFLQKSKGALLWRLEKDQKSPHR